MKHLIDLLDRLVVVHWVDTVTDHGWTAKSEAIKSRPHNATSIGWLIHVDGHAVILAQTKSDDQVNGTVTIPRAWLVGTVTAVEEPA